MKRRKTEPLSPRRSTSPENIPSHEEKKHSNEESGNNVAMILEQDRFLPIANISRIMKRVIPSDGKLSKEAKECVQECITEFLLFITSEASEKCDTEKRKTITGEDLIVAFQTLGFDDYVEPLKEFLYKYREANKSHSMKSEELSPNCDSIPPKLTSYATTDHSVQQLQEPQAMMSQDLPHFDGSASSSTTSKYAQKPKMEAAPVTASTTLQPIYNIYLDAASGQHYTMVQSFGLLEVVTAVLITSQYN
ncbi:histone-like transcription factor (CBF/NF-Y) and archaeal histone domain-containing protein [Ditylenchus destructor]|uniref:Histone-like transcription factor (CBF/NF-Y) and archaeal histone domain-containing protein n=1 Tax=Ditylenchus destructor TaxID=166010 RepID=A0AAD4NBI7_9BILA|nr:histone-like transcription factor (CBF/NF-Y) and archaeal histone domain-containing protein [Ditylenchus destructor]